jgi:hypothetical protein
VLCCCLLEALHQPPPIPMAYRRKQGAADDHRSSYPQARTPLSPPCFPPLPCLLACWLPSRVPDHFLGFLIPRVLLQSQNPKSDRAPIYPSSCAVLIAREQN